MIIFGNLPDQNGPSLSKPHAGSTCGTCGPFGLLSLKRHFIKIPIPTFHGSFVLILMPKSMDESMTLDRSLNSFVSIQRNNPWNQS